MASQSRAGSITGLHHLGPSSRPVGPETQHLGKQRDIGKSCIAQRRGHLGKTVPADLCPAPEPHCSQSWASLF